MRRMKGESTPGYEKDEERESMIGRERMKGERVTQNVLHALVR